MTTERKIDNVRIASAHRRNNSASGNPGWKLMTDHGTFVTETDAQIGYSITNLMNAEHAAIGDGAEPVTLLVRGATRVYGIERNGVALR